MDAACPPLEPSKHRIPEPAKAPHQNPAKEASMRHENCLACRTPGAFSPELRELLLITESVAGPDFMHHHHTVECGGCRQWWFDDVVIGGLGIPVASRRGTGFCPCDDSLKQYTSGIVHVPAPESKCECTKAKVDEFRLDLRRPARPGEHEPSHSTVMPRDSAVREIGTRVGDQTAFIIAVPPDALARVARALRGLPGTDCYLDIGASGVFSLRSPHLAEVATLVRGQPPGTACAVFTVPKTIPARRLSKLLGVEIPADGSQDLVMIQTRGLFDLPALLVDAIGVHDPRFAAEIYANDLRNQS